MHNKNETVLEHYKEGVSVVVSKNHFYDREILACNFMYNVNVKCHGFSRHCLIH